MKSKSITTSELPSCRDQESGLYNQGHFKSVLNHELVRLDRWKHPLSLVLIKITGLPSEQWATLGRLLLSSLRGIDLAGRLKKDKAAILLPDFHTGQAKRWLASLQKELQGDSALAKYPCLFGLALARPWEGTQGEELLAMAEAELKTMGPPLEDLESDQDDLDTSIATGERNLLFDGFRALTISGCGQGKND